MPIRYSDIEIAHHNSPDFVIRRRPPTLPQLATIFLSALLISLSMTVAVMDRLALVVMLIILFSSVAWYAILQLQRSRDLVLTTEFQNALFASALGINNKFCVIIKRDGNIVYLDRSFQELFPDYVRHAGRTIDTLFDHGHVERADREKIFSSIERGVYDKVVFEIRGSGGQFHKIVMSIEPILRPSGFILLRGREYVEQRAAQAADVVTPPDGGDMLNKSSITLFSHVMDTMNMGVYMSGPAGALIYANPVLEQWLNYRDGELSSKSMTLQDIIYQGGNRKDTIEPDNYEGEVILLKKNGGKMKAFVNQKVIRNDQNKVMGCTALVHSIADVTNADAKKKLW